ncbi:MAG TPA: SusD/RagB family nutrient-binding outer membrane lipoprotein [Draconibacterium sp.]|nr:SusD/RagB family nutrient-binding outer membrane lipoprotein [Draconibacterium sp.]
MRNIFIKSALSFLILFSSFACQDELERLYQDPDGFSKEQADKSGGVSVIAGFFTSELTRNFLFGGDYGALYHQMRSGSRVMGAGVQLYRVLVDGGESPTLKDVEHDWGTSGFNETVFNKINDDWIKQVLWAQREFNNIPEEERTNLDKLFMELLIVVKAHGYQRATDLYDKVPYIETGSAGGLDGDKAQYIGQSEIYPKIIAELKGADEFLAALNLSVTEQTTFANQDVIFGGSIDKWRRYINSLRLRCAMNVSEVTPNVTQTVLQELNGKPLMTDYNDVAGLADIAFIEPYRIQVELGITRSFRERSDDCRAPKRFLDDVMNCKPIEKSKVINGQTLYYFEGDNSATGLLDGTVDPRVSYVFSPDWSGRYLGAETSWDDGTNPNSYMSKIMRGYYINDPILTDPSITTFTYGKNHNITIKLNDEATNDITKRDKYLLTELRKRVANYEDIDWTIGKENNLVAEYNVRPQFNFQLRWPTIHAVETELSLAEAAVRGFGTLNGSAREHYKNAIELSCKYWFELNNSNQYSKQTTPAFPSNMDDSRVNTKPAMEYDASAYAEYAAKSFDAMSQQEKVHAIFNQLELHYNFMNWEVTFTAARRMIKFIGTNPGSPYEVYKWKERMTYPGGIQASDPANWAIISPDNDPDKPVWLTGRTTKWKNKLE